MLARSRKYSTRIAAVLVCLVCQGATALELGAALGVKLEPRIFNSNLVTAQAGSIDAARFESGLGLGLGGDSFRLDFDADLQYSLAANSEASAGTLSRQFKAALSSTFPSGLPGVDGEMTAGTLFRQAGDNSHNNVSVGLVGAFAKLVRFNFSYEFARDKQLSRSVGQRALKGYSTVLSGMLREGRLHWVASYKSTELFQENLALAQKTTAFYIKSRYQFSKALRMNLLSAVKRETLFSGAGSETYLQRRYRAALAWSPAGHYSVALRVSLLDDDYHASNYMSGSGSVSWFPWPELELALDYGQHQVDGVRGWMARARYNFKD